MNLTEYIENDGPCYIGFLVRKIALDSGWVHPEWGEIVVIEKKGNDISLVVDGRKRLLRIVEYKDKRKYSYLNWEFISPKDKKVISTGEIKWPLDIANAIRNL